MELIQQSCSDFCDKLASNEPVPGGGGASALAGALGAALGSMVSNLTVNKKKYIAVKEEIEAVLEKCEALRADLLALVDEDAKGFAPLAEAYRLPKETQEEAAYKAKVLEQATKDACSVPVAIMEKAVLMIDLHARLCEIGSRMLISDVGVGVLMCKAALKGASLNVFINTKSLIDRVFAENVDRRCEQMLKYGCKKADDVYESVLMQIK